MSEQEPRDGRARAAARLDAVFGEVLPETTADERDSEASGYTEAFYRENRPPHHDRAD